MRILLLGDTRLHAVMIAKLRASSVAAHFTVYGGHDGQRRFSRHHYTRAEHWHLAEDAARFAALHRSDVVINMDDSYDAACLAGTMQNFNRRFFTAARRGTGEIKPDGRRQAPPLPVFAHHRADTAAEITRVGEDLINRHGAVLCHVGHLTLFQQAYLIRHRDELAMFAERIAESGAINKKTPSVFLEQPSTGMTYYYFAFCEGQRLAGAAFCHRLLQRRGAPCMGDMAGGGDGRFASHSPHLFPLPERDAAHIQSRFVKPLLDSMDSNTPPFGWFLLRIDWTTQGPKIHSLHQSFNPTALRILADSDDRDWLALILGIPPVAHIREVTATALSA